MFKPRNDWPERGLPWAFVRRQLARQIQPLSQKMWRFGDKRVIGWLTDSCDESRDKAMFEAAIGLKESTAKGVRGLPDFADL